MNQQMTISHFDHFVLEFDKFYNELTDKDECCQLTLSDKNLSFDSDAIVTESLPLSRNLCSNAGSLEERIDNIRRATNLASQARYLATQDPEVILANLIMQILEETEGQTGSSESRTILDDILLSPRKLEEVLPGFEFYDNNPYRAKAEKRLEKIRRKNFK